MKRYALTALLLLSGAAYAAPLNFSWVAPTQRTDGTALPTSQIAGYKVEWGTCNGALFGSPLGSLIAPNTATTASSPNVSAGTYCGRVFTNATDGTVSASSNVGIKTVLPAPPNPPTLVTVTTVAYELRDSWWRSPRMVKVGWLPVGSACDERWSRNGSYATVDPDSVVTTRKYKGGALYGRCV